MFKRLTRFALVLVVLAALAPVHFSTAQEEESSLFTPYSDMPVVPRGEAGSWYYNWNEPGDVVFYEDKFYFFRNGNISRPSAKANGLMKSTDGYEWEMQNDDEPIMTSADFDYGQVNISLASIVVLKDDTWAGYIYTQEGQDWLRSGGDIVRVTAASPTGPWEGSAEPVLVRGSASEWDELRLAYPDVHQTKDGYVMYYGGFNNRGGIAIGMATSEDGITWEKYDDPTTTEAPYAESDPMLMGEGSKSATMPHVQHTDDGWLMIYKDGSLSKILIATSEDGMDWTTQEGEVISSDDFNANVIGFMSFFHHEDTYYLFLEAVPSGGFSEIYLATYEGALLFED